MLHSMSLVITENENLTLSNVIPSWVVTLILDNAKGPELALLKALMRLPFNKNEIKKKIHWFVQKKIGYEGKLYM